VLEVPRNDLGAEFGLGLIQSGVLGGVEVGEELPDVLVVVDRVFSGLETGH